MFTKDDHEDATCANFAQVADNGKPAWSKKCTHCMACICYCPTKAIEYGKKSVGKPRYHFEELKIHK